MSPLRPFLFAFSVAAFAPMMNGCANCEDQTTAPHPKDDVQATPSDKLQPHGKAHIPKMGAQRTLERILAQRKDAAGAPSVSVIDTGTPPNH